jgi:hypothetical protein
MNTTCIATVVGITSLIFTHVLEFTYKALSPKESSTCPCPICFEDIPDKNNEIVLGCKHVYHRDCIIPWIKKKQQQNHMKCPCCRKQITRRILKKYGIINIKAKNYYTIMFEKIRRSLRMALGFKRFKKVQRA